MSLFHNLLSIKKIGDAAKQGHGYVGLLTFKDLAAVLPWTWQEVNCSKPDRELVSKALPERWSVIDGQVIDLNRLSKHPGGQAVLSQAERRDATVLFHSVHALANEERVAQWLQGCVVGRVKDFAMRTEPLPGGVVDWRKSLSPLARELQEEVRAYFKGVALAKGVSLQEARKATTSKWLLVAALWLVYCFVFRAWLQGSLLGLLLYPFCGALATFHTFHDASHGALSSRAWVNELLTFSGFLISAPHEWYWQHIGGHHAYTNLAGLDPDSKHANRWVKSESRLRWFLLSFFTVWAIAVPVGLHVLASSRFLLGWTRQSGLDGHAFVPAPPLASIAAVVVQRLVCYVLPIWRFGLAWGLVWAGFPAVVFSVFFMLNTQLAHLNEETQGEVEQKHAECWYQHQLATTVDFGPDSWLHWFLSGGLNLQVEHHLFPAVDHSHLPALRTIVKRVCASHGIEVHSAVGYLDGLRSHLRFLGSERPASPPSRTTGSIASQRWWLLGSTLVVAGVAALVLGPRVAAVALAIPVVMAVLTSPGGQRHQEGAPNGLGPEARVDGKNVQLSPSTGDANVCLADDAQEAGIASEAGARTLCRRPRVCVVGSGIAGNGAAYFLRHACEVTLCEREERTGGHAHTVEVSGHRVDIGFQVFNYANYPLLTKLFEELGVATVQSDMSLSVASRGMGRDFEWSSRALFPSWASLLSIGSWLRLVEILRFEGIARQALLVGDLGNVSLRDWLAHKGFSARLTEEYLAPMGAALWSCPTDTVLGFPAVTVLGFLENHFMLQRTRPKWRTVRHRSEDYVARLHAALRTSGATVRAPMEVARLEAAPGGGVSIFDVQGRLLDLQPFDRVVLAVHADEAMAILRRSKLPQGDLEKAETLLGGFRYFANTVAVHTDARFMPSNRKCWGAWNALQLPGSAVVTYWVNKLQPGAARDADVFVTLNAPEGTIPQEALLKSFVLDHPVLDDCALATQRGLPTLQGLAGGAVFLCGAWAGHGFHEDGLRSAREACVAMGVDMSAWPSARLTLTPLSRPARMLWSLALLPGLRHLIRKGSLRITFSDGLEAELGDGTGASVEIRVHSERFLWRVVLDPGIGLADAFIEGEMDVKPDILDLFKLMLANKPQGDKTGSPMAWSPLSFVTPLAKKYYASLHARRANSSERSKKNVAAHCDLSNAMFGMFLSPDMTYSAGIFDEEVEALQREALGGEADFLERAQRKKLDRILDLIELQDGDTVLEIGCGWGSMAIRAAQRCPGLKMWTAVTLSQQQLELATKRVAEANLAERVRVVFCDYRDAPTTFGRGVFSKVVSIEMIEAVGHEFLPGYFAAIDQCLKPGGKAAIQAICVPDERYESYRRGTDFIRERIFPGSHLPCLGEIERACKGCTSLRRVAEDFSVGTSHAKTLREWRRRFAAHEADVRSDGFDERFIRQWHYYFAYCEAGFETGHLDNWQICLQKSSSETEAASDAHEG